MKKFTPKTYLVAVLAVLLLGGTAFALTRPDIPAVQTDTPKPVTKEEVKTSESASSQPDSQSQSQSQTPPAQNLPTIAKPTLSKSSGNNGPVSAKANIQFVCSGALEASCFVTLTNKDNPSDNLKFDAKTIKDDGRGNNSVTWIWEAKPGTWTVVATQSASGYQPNSSDAQTLTVNP